MTDIELAALTAMLAAETTEREGCIRQFGERPWDCRTPTLIAMEKELERRGITTAPERLIGGHYHPGDEA